MAQPTNPEWSPIWDEEAQLPPSYSNSTSPTPSNWQKFCSHFPGSSSSASSFPEDGIPMIDNPASLRLPINSLSERMLALAASAATQKERIAATNMVPQILEKELGYRKAVEGDKERKEAARIEKRDTIIPSLRDYVVGPLFWIAVVDGVVVFIFWMFKYF